MNKAILVIDMPKYCPSCPVAHYNKLDEFTGCDIVGGKRYAITTEKGYKDTNYKPGWCPLRPLPRKREKDRVPTMTVINGKEVNEYDLGWNDCIDELLGGEE